MPTLSSGYKKAQTAGLITCAVLAVVMLAFFLQAPTNLPAAFKLLEDGTIEVTQTVSKWYHFYQWALIMLGLVLFLFATDKGRNLRGQFSSPKYYKIKSQTQVKQSGHADRLCIFYGWLFIGFGFFYWISDLYRLLMSEGFFGLNVMVWNMMNIGVPLVLLALIVAGIVGTVRIIRS